MLWDNVLIKKLEKKVDLVIPDQQARIPNKGIVVATGPGGYYGYNELVPITVCKGDIVYFLRDRAMEIELKGVKHWVVKERDLLGIMSNEEAKD